jgi:hypothetical protein
MTPAVALRAAIKIATTANGIIERLLSPVMSTSQLKNVELRELTRRAWPRE